MKPAFVFPFHDPDGLLWDRLPDGLLDLESKVDRAFVGVTKVTASGTPDLVAWLEGQRWIEVVHVPDRLPVGAQFRYLYTYAAETTDPRQRFHLCFPDRLLFALSSHERSAFLRDIQDGGGGDAPVVYQRSEQAWATHPRTYREAEGLVTTLGRLLIGRDLDFAWCHLSILAQDLAHCLPRLRRDDLSLLAELLWCIKDRVQTKPVDWLAWEDPFVLGRDAHDLRIERDGSPAEVRKRLSYVLPMLDVLASFANEAAPGVARGSDPRESVAQGAARQ